MVAGMHLRALLSVSPWLLGVTLIGCRDEAQTTPLFDASPVAAPSASAAVDLSQCPGCQLAPQPAWTFAGVYRDAACTEPLAQALVPACAPTPALAAASLTYVDEVGSRKAGDTAEVTLTEAVAPDAPRYRKTAKGCAAANEMATAVAPTCAAGSKACRNAAGALACDGCRTFANGCPDYQETRLYAVIDDPSLKTAGGGGGSGGGLAALRACCSALSKEGKRLGASPEGGLLLQAAAQCQAVAANSAGGVELAAFKSMLGGRKIPALCAGL